MIATFQTKLKNDPELIHIERTAVGWKIGHVGDGFLADCMPDGEAYLYHLLDNRAIDYPAGMKDYMRTVWEKGEDYEPYLNELVAWVNKEQSDKPMWLA